MLGYQHHQLVPEHSQCAIIAQLAPIVDHQIHTRYRVFAAVCHLKAKSGHEVLRQRQVAALIHRVEQYQSTLSTVNYRCHASTLVVGDFNDEPRSLAFDELQHSSLAVRSLYDDHFMRASPSCEYYTTYKRRLEVTKRVIDYVWFTPSTLKPRALLSIPAVAQFPALLPASNYASDHLALMGEFAVLKHERPLSRTDVRRLALDQPSSPSSGCCSSNGSESEEDAMIETRARL